MKSERLRWAIFAVVLFVVECLIATVWRRVPFVRSDLGDYLVVILLYAMFKAARPFHALPLSLCVFGIGVAVECAQALSLADRLGFARGSVASIVIGNTFGWSDIAMYAAGCMTCYLIDRGGRA